MRAIKKSLIMRGMVMLHYVVMVALFVVCWWQFYRFSANEHIFIAYSLCYYIRAPRPRQPVAARDNSLPKLYNGKAMA